MKSEIREKEIIDKGTSTTFEWRRHLRDLLSAETCSPRGMEVRERIGFQTRVDMTSPFVSDPTRKVHLPFLFGEAYWILSGDNRVGTIKPFNRHIERFSDDGDVFFGAYGPKIKSQIDGVIDKLVSDSQSRQAVINIWRENPPITKDVPCTLSFQFLRRFGKLHVLSTMRSNDVWLGYPYDIFNFSMLGWYVSMLLSENGLLTTPQFLHHRVGSFHLYEENVAAARQTTATISRNRELRMLPYSEASKLGSSEFLKYLKAKANESLPN